MTSTTIKSVIAWEALDSRGQPTVAARVELVGGARGQALAPAGASTGAHEAVERRDREDRYAGFGVRGAVADVNGPFADALIGQDVTDQHALDTAIMGVRCGAGGHTTGANSTIAVSVAGALAAAQAGGQSLARHLSTAGGASERAPLELPMPMINIISGGAHARGAIDIQDVLVIPRGAKTFAQGIEWAGAVRRAATRVALELGYDEAALVADEGGLGIPLSTNCEALEVVVKAIERAGLRPGTDLTIAIDCAATQFHSAQTGRYTFAREGRDLSTADLIAEYSNWVDRFPITSIEDAFAEDDWPAWAEAMTSLGDRIDLVGDDLFVTQQHRLTRGIAESSANSILIKVNQNGLVSSTGDVLGHARGVGMRTIVSARSGDTEDSWLSDLAVGWRGGQIKVGSTLRSERTAKWNRLLELEATEPTTLANPWGTR